MSLLPPPTEARPTSGPYTCPYCRLESDAAGIACVHCGSPVDIRARVSASGWERQPPIKDLARIQFGQSTCQVSGTYVPVAEFRLADGESIFFSHHLLLWADTVVRLGARQMRKTWERNRAGMPLVMMEAIGPGTVALSDDHPGESVAVPMMPGRTVDVREHRFLMASDNVTYDWFSTGIWYTTRNGDDTETHYPAGMYVDRFDAQDRPGLLLLHSPGNVFVRELAAGETICIHPGSLLWKDSTAGMGMHLERPRGGSWISGSWRPATPWLRVWGPGRVAVSSAYGHLEGTGRITNTSQATTMDWNTVAMQNALRTAAATPPSAQAVALKAALDEFATAQGFEAVSDTDRGPMHMHGYRHPGGLEVGVVLVDQAAAASMLNQMGGAFGQQGAALAGAAGRVLGVLAKRAAKGMAAREPVQDLGDEAYWKAGDGSGDLTVVKSGQQLRVKITGAVSAEDQLGWARAFARAGLSAL